MPINFPQGFYEAAVFLGLEQALKSVIPVVSERLKDKVMERQQYQVLTRNFINSGGLDASLRDALLAKYAQAVLDKMNDPRKEGRIIDAYTTVYAAFEVIQDPDECQKQRKQAFENLGRAAMDQEPDPTLNKFEVELAFIESHKFFTWFLIARKLGIDVWEFLKDTAWPELRDFFERHPAIQERLDAMCVRVNAEIHEHRESMREWAEEQTIAVQEAAMWSILEAEERPPDRGIYYAAGIVLAVLAVAVLIGLCI